MRHSPLLSGGAGAIAGYGGSAFTAQISVSAGTESLVASTAVPLTESTLDESVITLTLSGRAYEDSSYTVGACHNGIRH